MDFTLIEREDFRDLLAEIGRMRMPFGKYGPASYPPSGVPLIDLPPDPKGRLGELMAHVCEIKDVGMDSVFDPIRAATGGRFPLHPPRTREFRFDT
ncbi:MAG: DUF3820 family protein [Akkermansiaceae bacterium]|nr:DUF3820 family protein [Akkermansiaceae bacterium]